MPFVYLDDLLAPIHPVHRTDILNLPAGPEPRANSHIRSFLLYPDINAAVESAVRQRKSRNTQLH